MGRKISRGIGGSHLKVVEGGGRVGLPEHHKKKSGEKIITKKGTLKVHGDTISQGISSSKEL